MSSWFECGPEGEAFVLRLLPTSGDAGIWNTFPVPLQFQASQQKGTPSVHFAIPWLPYVEDVIHQKAAIGPVALGAVAIAGNGGSKAFTDDLHFQRAQFGSDWRCP
ncbi:MAG: hypothetical protein M9900_05035 [Flavobacteriales bacterium]|nr:hypothetical protein [Bacteroidota bacterium]MCO5274266.1 hypothetical protein [Flavobacteriales bacterium]